MLNMYLRHLRQEGNITQQQDSRFVTQVEMRGPVDSLSLQPTCSEAS